MAKVIAPKRQGLFAAEENLDKLMEVLQVKRDELYAVTAKLLQLNNDLEDKQNQKKVRNVFSL